MIREIPFVLSKGDNPNLLKMRRKPFVPVVLFIGLLLVVSTIFSQMNQTAQAQASKVKICHNFKVIEVSENALDAHLQHGDCLAEDAEKGEGDLCECGVTAITLLSFAAEKHDSNVILAWQTATEIDNAGFNLWRSEAGKEQYVKLNEHLIPGQGYTYQDTSYSFTDTTVTAGVAYEYKLEDVDLHGKSTFHGPVSVEIGKNSSQITLRLNAGINLISVPLNPGTPWTIRDLGNFIGREKLRMIISMQNGQFKVYAPDWGEGRSASVPITGDDAYIVVMKYLAEVTFTGTAWDGKVSLKAGLNLLAVPVNPSEMRLSDLAQEIGSNLSSIFWYNRAVRKFTKYQPSATMNRRIRAGEGYIVSMTAPAELTFEGEAWTNTPAEVMSAPAFTNANRMTPLLMVEGTVVGAGPLPQMPSSHNITVTVRNLNDKCRNYGAVSRPADRPKGESCGASWRCSGSYCARPYKFVAVRANGTSCHPRRCAIWPDGVQGTFAGSHPKAERPIGELPESVQSRNVDTL